MTAPRVPILERLGLHRRELRAWAAYDWANSAMFTVIVASVFPVYFAKSVTEDPGAADRDLSLATALALAVAAVVGPIIGAVADVRPWKKRLLAAFQAAAVLASAALAFTGRGDATFALVLFGVANVGASTAFVLYDALLPHVARDEELDRVSTTGYALGYLGGGIALALVFAAVRSPSTFGFDGPGAATRAGFLLVAAWWVVFSMPLFRRVPEPALGAAGGHGGGTTSAIARLRQTFRDLRRFPDALTLMVAFLLYNDGIGAIIRLAAVVGEQRKFSEATLFGSILAVQFVGIPFAFLFGGVAGRIGAKRSIFVALGVYCLVTVLAARMTTETEFWMLALLVGSVQGGAQALSRSLFASMVPRERSAEFFGLFGVFERFAGILGPLVFGLMRSAGFDTTTSALSLLPFFAGGALLLSRVDVAEGRACARAAEAVPAAA